MSFYNNVLYDTENVRFHYGSYAVPHEYNAMNAYLIYQHLMFVNEFFIVDNESHCSLIMS